MDGWHVHCAQSPCSQLGQGLGWMLNADGQSQHCAIAISVMPCIPPCRFLLLAGAVVCSAR